MFMALQAMKQELENALQREKDAKQQLQEATVLIRLVALTKDVHVSFKTKNRKAPKAFPSPRLLCVLVPVRC